MKRGIKYIFFVNGEFRQIKLVFGFENIAGDFFTRGKATEQWQKCFCMCEEKFGIGGRRHNKN